MSEFINNISQFIQSQFPEHYREQTGVELTQSQRAVIIDFVEAYYEWVESVSGESFIRNRQMFQYRDIDTTLDEFIKYFRNTFLRDITYESATDDRYVVKHIMDLYRSKGSPAAVKLLIRLIFNEDANVYIPGQDVLRASDSRWFEPSYVEVYSDPITKTFLNKRIFGSKSGASAFVEGVVTKRVKGRLIDVIYLSSNEGIFLRGDKVSFDGVMDTAREVVGSLSDIILNRSTIGGFSVGETVDVESDSGRLGQAIVRSVFTESNAIDFFLIDGGFGYTLDNRTKTYVSDLIVQLENENPTFAIDDVVTQRVETVYITANSSIASEVSAGDNIIGLSGNTVVANGTVLSSGTEVVNNIITEFVKIQIEDDTNTFISNQILTFETDAQYLEGETVVDQSSLTLTIVDANGTFTNGEVVFTKTYFAGSNNVSESFAFGEVVDANSSFVELEYAYGQFEVATLLTGRDSGATATILAVSPTTDGKEGTVLRQLTNNSIEVILGDQGAYSASSRLYGKSSKISAEVLSINTTGIESVFAANTEALIQPTLTTDSSFSGVVVGQNTICFGVANTTDNPFVFVDGISSLKNQNEDEVVVTSIAGGTGAAAEIASPLLFKETIELATEALNVTNVYDVELLKVKINGSGSGVGYVDSVTVNDGGTGYSNADTVTFSAGGFADQDVVFPATGTLTTDANGAIQTITITDTGEGYFETPDITISGGSGANVSINTVFGYGVEAELFANSQSTISDILTSAPVEIGTIAALTGVKRGDNYTRAPFVRFVNPSLQIFNIKDQVLNTTLTSGSFANGELITQANTGGRGIITNRIGNELYVRTATVNGLFESGNTEIVGTTTGARAIVNTATINDASLLLGENAVVNSFLLDADGVIDRLEIARSGYGYFPGEEIRIRKDNDIITGTAVVESQGIDYGYWKTQTSHISEDKYLHDNNYYQEYSYDIQSGVNLNEYREIILNILHLAGTKLFGTVIKTTEKTQPVTLESSITQE